MKKEIISFLNLNEPTQEDYLSLAGTIQQMNANELTAHMEEINKKKHSYPQQYVVGMVTGSIFQRMYAMLGKNHV